MGGEARGTPMPGGALLRLGRRAFFLLVVRPFLLIVLGLNVRHRERLPLAGPAIIAANHNSHLDTLALMTLFPSRLLGRLRPVGAADYFMRNRLVGWFTTRVIGMIPLARDPRVSDGDPFAGVHAALEAGDIIILYPEGTRGEPEQLKDFKSGIAHLARRHPGVPVYPVYLHGLGKALPRGEAVLVPFFCDVFIGEAIGWPGDKTAFMADLAARVSALAAEGGFPPWE